MQGKVLITARSFLENEGPQRRVLREAGYEIIESHLARPLRAAELGGLISAARAALLGVDEVNADVIGLARQLEVISRFGVGVDTIDLEAATRHGIVVTNTPDANTVSVAELTIGLIFALARHIPLHDRLMKQGDWQRFKGVEISGAVLGITGMGRIGREVAQRASALGMRILYYDVVPPPRNLMVRIGASACTFDVLLSRCDVVSLHLPLNDRTRNLVNREAIGRMKPSALLINTARGGLIDEKALYEALASGKLSGAACDVFSREPPFESPLLSLDNFVATPHAGAATVQSRRRMAKMAVDNLLAVLRGERPSHVVNPEVYERARA